MTINNTKTLKAPFPYFGGKSRIAPMVWERFGVVRNYVEPFFGSGAMLLARPEPHGTETINDACGYVANFWRALQADPEEVCFWADHPVFENDLHARHVYLRRLELRSRLEGDMEWYDAKAAGLWVWGISCWIGSGWCSDLGNGPWHVIDGEFVKQQKSSDDGFFRIMPALGDGGKGVKRQIPHLTSEGQGVKRQIPHLGDGGKGVAARNEGLLSYLLDLRERLRGVRVCCGDWSRVCGPSVTVKHGLTAMFLDPPYSAEDRDPCYAQEDFTVAKKVREYCLENGQNPLMRIALSGYDTEHAELVNHGWVEVPWKAVGGMGNKKSSTRGRENAFRERIWFSPHCLNPQASAEDASLFD